MGRDRSLPRWGGAVARIDVRIDRLMVDVGLSTLEPEPAGNLLRRPAGLQPINHSSEKVWQPDQLTLPPTTIEGLPLRQHATVAAELR